MSGYARQGLPNAPVSGVIALFIGEREVHEALCAADPFGVADFCEFGPRGEHKPIGSCGDVVCCYCARIFWS